MLEGIFSLVIAELHHQADSQVPPVLRHALASFDDPSKSLFGLLPFAALHHAEPALEVFFHLDQLIQCEVFT